MRFNQSVHRILHCSWGLPGLKAEFAAVLQWSWLIHLAIGIVAAVILASLLSLPSQKNKFYPIPLKCKSLNSEYLLIYLKANIHSEQSLPTIIVLESHESLHLSKPMLVYSKLYFQLVLNRK